MMFQPQRSDAEMLELLCRFADDPRIRVATLEGSRTNPNIPKDALQDFDVSYFVTDVDAFTQDPSWLGHFGTVIMLQTPESMELFPPSLDGESYLMICDDLTKIDLTLYPLSHLDRYFEVEDRLKEVLVDKDERITFPVIPTDREYHVTRPTVGAYTDCLNEFWFVATYVAKGLCRGELLFAADHMNQIMRRELLRMWAWEAGEAKGYGFSVGKNYKFLNHYVDPREWSELMATFRMDGGAPMYASFLKLLELMRVISRRVGETLGYPYPSYDSHVSAAIDEMVRRFGIRG